MNYNDFMCNKIVNIGTKCGIFKWGLILKWSIKCHYNFFYFDVHVSFVTSLKSNENKID